MYGKGISKEGSLIDVGVDLEIIKKSGAWFTYEGDQLGQGRENARQFLAEHIDLRDEIERKVRDAVGLTASVRGRRRAHQGRCRDPSLEEPSRWSRACDGRQGSKAVLERDGEHSGDDIGARSRARRAATSAPSGSWPCVRGAAGSWSGVLLGAGSSRRGAGCPDAARTGRAGGRRGVRAAIRGTAVRLPQGGQPRGRAGPSCSRHRPRRSPPVPPRGLPSDEEERADDLARSRASRLRGVPPHEGFHASHIVPGADADTAPRSLAAPHGRHWSSPSEDRVAPVSPGPGRSIGTKREEPDVIPKPYQTNDRRAEVTEFNIDPTTRSDAHVAQKAVGARLPRYTSPEAGGTRGPLPDDIGRNDGRRHRRPRRPRGRGSPRDSSSAHRSERPMRSSAESQAKKLLLEAEEEAAKTRARGLAGSPRTRPTGSAGRPRRTFEAPARGGLATRAPHHRDGGRPPRASVSDGRSRPRS